MRIHAELRIIPTATHLFEEPGTLEQVAEQAGNWFDTYRRTWDIGLTRFRITQTGFYRLRYDYYWFNSNEYVSGHTSSLSWGLRDDRLSSLTTTVWKYVDWCQY